MSQLGFTFYPKDWWTSDSFFLLQPFERYIYLECLFMMYSNDGWISNNKLIVERRLGTTIKDEVWSKITDLMVKEGDQITHKSVNKRLRKTIANRENGLKGGRPKKVSISDENSEAEKPKKPKKETQPKTQKNPPLEKEKEREEEYKKEREIEGEKETEKFTPSTTKEILSSRKIVIEQWAMNYHVTIERIQDCIIEFADFKYRSKENLKWQNESDLIKNFEFWLNSNAKPKQKSNFNQNGTTEKTNREIFRNR